MPRRHSAVSALLILALASPASAQLTDSDRQRLVAHLEMTAGWLADEVVTLSQPQLEFRRAPDTWNILEVLEHLVLVGPIYWEDLQKAMQAPAVTLGSASRDADILWYGIDRTFREPALVSETPRKTRRDLRSGLAEYRKNHARLLEYARTTKDDLRSHVVERQRCDAYQWALLISTHEQRHILQIREIKADRRFPKK